MQAPDEELLMSETILKNIQTDHTGLERKLEELKSSYTRVLEELELHKSVSPFHIPQSSSDTAAAAEKGETAPLISADGSSSSNYESTGDSAEPHSHSTQKKSLLQRLCCCCSLCDCCIIRD